MALTKLRNYNAGTDGAFITVVSVFESASPATHRRVLITSDDGTCQGYERIADSVLFCGALVTPNAAKIAADSAAASASSTDATKATAATATVLNQVARVRAIAPASRTDQDKWLMALSFLMFRQE